MKKLMFAAVAIAAGAVFADGEITSQNIVGYAENDDALNPNAGTLVSSQFVKVGEDGKFCMADLKPFVKTAEEWTIEYGVNLQIQNDDGTCDDENGFTWNGSYWEDGFGVDATSRKFDVGTGFKIFLTADECYFQTDGQVLRNPVTVPLADSAGTNVGNPYALDVTFGSMTVAGDEYGYSVNAQIQNDDGSCDDENSIAWNGTGWEDGNGEEATDCTFKKGTCVRVFSFVSDASIYIPVPDALK